MADKAMNSRPGFTGEQNGLATSPESDVIVSIPPVCQEMTFRAGSTARFPFCRSRQRAYRKRAMERQAGTSGNMGESVLGVVSGEKSHPGERHGFSVLRNQPCSFVRRVAINAFH